MLRREAQDLGQALRQWVAEAEHETEASRVAELAPVAPAAVEARLLSSFSSFC